MFTLHYNYVHFLTKKSLIFSFLFGSILYQVSQFNGKNIQFLIPNNSRRIKLIGVLRRFWEAFIYYFRILEIGSLTRNSSTDLTDFKTRNEKRKVYNALAAASIFKNSAGVDTSRRQVVPMDAFLQFLTMFQKENLTEEEANQLIEVRK